MFSQTAEPVQLDQATEEVKGMLVVEMAQVMARVHELSNSYLSVEEWRRVLVIFDDPFAWVERTHGNALSSAWMGGSVVSIL